MKNLSLLSLLILASGFAISCSPLAPSVDKGSTGKSVFNQFLPGSGNSTEDTGNHVEVKSEVVEGQTPISKISVMTVSQANEFLRLKTQVITPETEVKTIIINGVEFVLDKPVAIIETAEPQKSLLLTKAIQTDLAKSSSELVLAVRSDTYKIKLEENLLDLNIKEETLRYTFENGTLKVAFESDDADNFKIGSLFKDYITSAQSIGFRVKAAAAISTLNK